MDRNRREAIAIFRYGIIAPVLHRRGQGQAEYFRALADTELEVPFLGRRSYTVDTFKAWLARYRRDGFEGLMPKNRCDCGVSRIIPPQLTEEIRSILTDHPLMPATQVRERLIAGDHITSKSPSETTLRRHINQEGLRPLTETPKRRRRFEKPEVNDMWTLDFMHGPRVPVEARRWLQKTYLAAGIDDHSRYVPVATFYLEEDVAAISAALQDGFLCHGLPNNLYCDNGPAFSSRHLALVCARLQIALIHSLPYDSPSRGKIERFFRTVRQLFLAANHEFHSLEDLNQRFRGWLDTVYHCRRHSGIGERPLDRYLRGLARIEQRTVTRDELARVFYRTLKRRVRNDCTVKIAGALWEVPANYVGQTIEIRHPEGRPEELYLFEDEISVCRLHPVIHSENANPGRPVRFALQNNDEEKP